MGYKREMVGRVAGLGLIMACLMVAVDCVGPAYKAVMLEPMDDNQPRLMESDEDAESSEVADMTRQLSDKITRVGNLKKEMEALQQQVLGESGKVSSAESSQTLSKFTKQLQSKKANIA